MPPKAGRPEKPDNSSRGIVKNTAKKVSNLTPRNSPKSTPRSTPSHKGSFSKVPRNGSANKHAHGPDGGLKTMQIDTDPHSQHMPQNQPYPHQVNFFHGYPQGYPQQHFRPNPYAQPYMPARQTYQNEPNTMTTLAHPIASDLRNGPFDMMYSVYQAKIQTLEAEILKLQHEKSEVQKCNHELVSELRKISDVVNFTLGDKVERGIGRK